MPKYDDLLQEMDSAAVDGSSCAKQATAAIRELVAQQLEDDKRYEFMAYELAHQWQTGNSLSNGTVTQP